MNGIGERLGRPPQSVRGRRELLEERILALGFGSNTKVFGSNKLKKLIKTPLYLRIYKEYIKFAKENESYELAEFVSMLSKELANGFSEIVLSENHDIPKNPEYGIKEAQKVEYELFKMDLKEKLNDLAKKIRTKETDRNKKGLRALETEFGKVSSELSKLETALSG